MRTPDQLQSSADKQKSPEITATKPEINETYNINARNYGSLNIEERQILKEQVAEALSEAYTITDKPEKRKSPDMITVSKKRESIRHAPSKTDRNIAYKSQLQDVQSELPLGKRVFSKLIHINIIEKTSDIATSTIARPNSLFVGSISAFVVIIACYLFGHFFGYKLSGFEAILGFLVGWLIGIIYDYASYGMRRNKLD